MVSYLRLLENNICLLVIRHFITQNKLLSESMNISLFKVCHQIKWIGKPLWLFWQIYVMRQELFIIRDNTHPKDGCVPISPIDLVEWKQLPGYFTEHGNSFNYITLQFATFYTGDDKVVNHSELEESNGIWKQTIILLMRHISIRCLTNDSIQ